MKNFLEIPVKLLHLESGVKVVFAPMKSTATVNVSFLFNVGSRNESDNEAGISHMFEHMLFKGTKKFPDWKMVTETIEGVGGIFNAFTDNEITGYWCKLPAEHIMRGLDVISDMAVQPNLSADELKREKQVVFEELKRSEDSPSEKSQTLLLSELWSGHELGRPIIGSVETVGSISAKDMHQFFKRYYTGPNLTVCIAGNFDEEKTLDVLKDRLSNMPKTKVTPPKVFSKSTELPKMKFLKRPIEQQRIALGVLAPSAVSKQTPALSVATTALGGTMFSRLFSEVREKRGLAYDIFAYLYSLSDTGCLVVSCGVQPDRTEEALRVVVEELLRIRDEGMSEQELEKTKNLIKGRMLLGMENARTVAEHFGVSTILRGKLTTVKEVLEELDQVSLQKVKEVLSGYLNASNVAFATVGPKDEYDALKTVSLIK